MSKVIITTESELNTFIQASVKKALADFQGHLNVREPDKYLNIKEAAAFLNLAPQTLYQFTSARTIPFIKKGKKLYFSRESLLTWLAQGQKKTVQELSNELKGKHNG